MSTVPVRLTVNGEQHEVEVEPRLLLVHLLRDTLGLTGTHVGCDTTNCGACTVHLDGEAVKSCTVLAVQADGAEVKTIEGMADGDTLHPLQEAFWKDHGLQCGYCTPGMIMAAADLLARNPDPTEAEVRKGLEGNLCRCTGYHNIVKAVLTAAEAAQERRERAAGGVGMSATEAPRDGRQRPRRPRAAAQGGPAPDHGPRLLRRRHQPHRASCGRRGCARPRRTRRSSRSTPRRRRRATASSRSTRNEDLDMEAGLPMAWVPPGVDVNTPDHWVLAKGEVKHVGDPVALVIGDDRYAVVDAAEDVIVEYDPLPVVIDPEAALEDGSALVHDAVRHQQGRASGRWAAATSRPASPRPTSSSSAGSSTTASPARRSSRAPCSPSTAPTS